MRLKQAKNTLKKYSSKAKARVLQGFFKTGPGQYGEGDVFIGVTVPNIRKVAKEYSDLGLIDVKKLLKSKVHEERLLALLILVFRFKNAQNEAQKLEIYDIYLGHTKYINNWDLVDLTAGYIVGPYLINKPKKPLYELADSRLLWDRRIAIVSTFDFIRNGWFKDTLKLSGILLRDKEDLMHKACGWMLREVGKRDLGVLEGFLKACYKIMPRTMLRYAIERFPETRRKAYLKGII